MKKVYDCMIVGAGVVGACIFNKMTRIGKSCLMLDKASDVATGASKANSGLIHAGYDPLPNSLKAKFNVRGNQIYPDLCARLGVPLKKCGALVVGDDEQKIDALLERGKQNGVCVEKWNREQIQAKIPQIADNISVALFARDAYIISPYLLTVALTEEGMINGGDVALEEDLLEVKKVDGVFEVKTAKNVYHCKSIVNSAGAGYNQVAKILGSERKKLQFRRGEYFVFDKVCGLDVPCTVFPLPTSAGKGVLVTPTVDGNFLIGPTSEESSTTTEVTRLGLETIKQRAGNIIKDVNFRQAIRQFAGVRVICGDDFVVEKSKKVDGVINLAGICSPGLSSAPAIAEYVCKLLNFDLTEKENLKKVEPYVMFKDMDSQTQQQLLKTDENYREIVCKCEHITKGDVLNALRRPLKISSVDGIKRRTNAGMGRCQGGFCFTKVVKTIFQERGIAYEKVKKENRGSEVALCDLREGSHD